MTANQSAMERLREAVDRFDKMRVGEHSLMVASAVCITEARAVLAEHDAAQKVAPSEAAKAWRSDIDFIANLTFDPGIWHSHMDKHLDKAMRLMSQHPAEAPKRLRAGARHGGAAVTIDLAKLERCAVAADESGEREALHGAADPATVLALVRVVRAALHYERVLGGDALVSLNDALEPFRHTDKETNQ